MENIDWFQFRTLAIIFVGVYLIFELVRLGVRQIIQVLGGRRREESLYKSSNIFSILRVVIIAFFLIFFIFTVIFNRTEIAEPHSDMGHDANIKALESIDTEKLKAAIENKEMESRDKALHEVNSESEKNYEEFLKQNSAQETK